MRHSRNPAVPDTKSQLTESKKGWVTEVLAEDLESELQNFLVSNFDTLFHALGQDAALLGERIKLNEIGKEPDFLCVARDKSVGVIELKRDRAQREVLAQVMEYASLLQSTSVGDLDARIQAVNGTPVGAAYENKYRTAFEQSSGLFIVIVAKSFSEEFKKIATFLNQHHCFSISLVSFSSKGPKGSKEFSFSPVLDARDCIEIMPPNLPSRAYAIRFEENGLLWDDCSSRNSVPLSAEGASLLQHSISEGCTKVAVDLAFSGYVGLGTVRKIRAASESTSMQIADVEWERKLPRDKAIYRSGIFRPSTCVEAMAHVETWQYLQLEFARRSKQVLVTNARKSAKNERPGSRHSSRSGRKRSATPRHKTQ